MVIGLIRLPSSVWLCITINALAVVGVKGIVCVCISTLLVFSARKNSLLVWTVFGWIV